MAESKVSKKGARTASARAPEAADGQRSNGFTAEERAAMKQRSQELKRAKAGKTDGEADVLAKIAEMSDHDRAMAERVHEIVKASAPSLSSRTWYGMPAYAKDGSVVCYFKNAQKFKTRYATFGFSDKANLDDGNMWPTEFALKEMSPDVERKLASLVRQAVN